jgi:hypothetical protein
MRILPVFVLILINSLAVPSGRAAGESFGELVKETHERSLAARRKVVEKAVAEGKCWPGGIWGEVLWSLAALYANEKVDQANELLRRRASEYLAAVKASETEPEMTPEKSTRPWGYFAITDYVRILCLFRADSPHFPGRLKPETEQAMKEALWLWVKAESKVAGAAPGELFVTLGTENHDLTRRPNHYLISEVLKEDPDFRNRKYDDGHTAAEHAAAYQEFYRAWPGMRAASGLWIELGSNTYQKYSWPALFNLHELSPDPLIRQRFGMLLDLALIEEAQISVRGRRGGGRSRASGGRCGFESYKNLLYGSDTNAASSHSKVIETSRYQVPPEAVWLRFREFPAKAAFEIRNRVLGQAAPQPPGGEEINRFDPDSAQVNYAYRTPHYLLGSTHLNPALQSPGHIEVEFLPQSIYHGISRQNRQCGLLFDDPESGEVAGVYPVIQKSGTGRPQHSFWTAQHRNVLLLQRIGQQTKQRMGSYSTGPIGIRFDGGSLKIDEQDGWIFADNGKAWIAVRFLDGGHRWDATKRLASPARFDGPDDTSRILMHAGSVAEHASFENFRKQVLANRLVVEPDLVGYQFGEARTRLVMHRFDVANPAAFKHPSVNGAEIPLKPEMTWNSPYLKGRFGSRRVEVNAGPYRRTLDFSAALEQDKSAR